MFNSNVLCERSLKCAFKVTDITGVLESLVFYLDVLHQIPKFNSLIVLKKMYDILMIVVDFC